MSDDNGQQPRKCLLGMPGYKNMQPGAACAWFLASAGDQAKVPLEINRQWAGGSLLSQQFNGLWCMAINHNVDYFAMLHSDVAAQKGWLDLLIAELEFRQLDVLSAVVPIKSPNGLTSTALDQQGGGEWLPQCRLTLREVYRLPETFTAADVGFPLLLNTGCWVAKMGPWATKVKFSINDRIVMKPDGNYTAEVEPEDWFFSRQCNRLGLKIGATRKVILFHDGEQTFTNTSPWGNPFDSEYIDHSLIPETGPHGFRFPYDVGGWLSYEEGTNLAELATGKRVLEIGSYQGRSTVCLAQMAKEVVAIDPHTGEATGRPMDTLATLKANLRKHNLDNVEIVVSTTAEVVDEDLLGQFDLVFIDGAHDRQSVQYDLEFALRRLAPGGLLAFHDYRKFPGEFDGRWDPGVSETVDEFLATGAKLISTHATLAVVKPPADILLEA